MSSNEPSTSSGQQPNGDASTAAAANGANGAEPQRPSSPPIPDDVMSASTDEVLTRSRLMENDIRVMKSEQMRLQHEQATMREKIKENTEKIRQNKILPYLVGNVVEVSLQGAASEAVFQDGCRAQYSSSWHTWRFDSLTLRTFVRRSSVDSRHRPRPRRRRPRTKLSPLGPTFSHWPDSSQMCSHQDVDSPDHLPPHHRSCRAGLSETRRSHRCQQGLLLGPR